MHKHLLSLAIILSALALQSCSSAPETTTQQPKAAQIIDPPNEALKPAMRNFFQQTGAPVASSYQFVRFDLNGDKRRDALVVIKTPYGYWCGQHGCVMLVMKAHNTGFSLVNSIQPLREPVYIARAKTNGWHNIVARVSGRWSEAKNVLLRFDGAQYPKNPDSLTPYPIDPANHHEFIRVLYDEGTR